MSTIVEVKPLVLIAAQSAVGASVPASLPPGKKLFQLVMGTGTATLKIQGSNDGVNWIDLHSETTAASAVNKGVEMDDIFAKHRANVSAWTSGQMDCTVSYPQPK